MSVTDGNVLEKFFLQCEECRGLSDDMICEHCGNIMVEVVNDVTELSQQKVKAQNLDPGFSPPTFERRREVNPLGMYLKEQKDILRKGNGSRKLDMVAEMRTWRNMNTEGKAKYKQMSMNDRNTLTRPDASEQSVEEIQDMLEKKKAKNRKDAEVKAIKKRQVDIMKVDVQSSRALMYGWIHEKKASIADLDQDILHCDRELEDLSKEIVVSDKLLAVKKSSLVALKKEYKELFPRIKNSGTHVN